MNEKKKKNTWKIAKEIKIKNVFHSQIPSRDLGSHCLCVAGEVYCWWQTYGGQRIDILTPKSTQVSEEEEDQDDEADSGILEDDTEQEDKSKADVAPEASGESSAEASGQQQDVSVGLDHDLWMLACELNIKFYQSWFRIIAWTESRMNHSVIFHFGLICRMIWRYAGFGKFFSVPSWFI